MNKGISWGVVAVVTLWAVMLWGMLELQRIFYTVSGPFYDSVSYYSYLARMLQTVEERGFWAALAEAGRGSTVALPWIQAAVLGLFTTKPALWMGPVMQAPWMLSLMLSVYAYARKVGGQSRLVALLMVVPFVVNGAVMFYNRGWSDFAMDLMQYVILGNALVFYLWSWQSTKRWPWIAAGVFFGLACLFRSTALVYVALIVAPMELYRLIKARGAWSVLKRQLELGAWLVAVCGWFYIINWNTLYYYYVVWNVDAQAHLPLSESVRHWGFVWDMHVGRPMLALLGTWFVVRVVQGIIVHRWNVFGKINWGVLWCGLVPVGFLIVKGAGLNPFVCVPAVFGLTMWLLYPIKRVGALPLWLGVVMLGLTVVSAAPTVQKGIADHMMGLPWAPREPLQDATDALTKDAKARGLTEARWALPFCGGYHFDVIEHLWRYEQGGVRKGDAIELDGVAYRRTNVLSEADAKALQAGDAQPVLKEMATVDYIYLQEADSVAKFEEALKYPPTNLLQSELGETLRAAKEFKLERVGGPWQINENDRWGLWRVVR